FDELQPAVRFVGESCAPFERARISVDRKDAASSLQNSPAVAAAAKSAVDVTAAFDDGELLQHLGQEDRHMAGRSAITLRRGAARVHAGSPLPGFVFWVGLDRPRPRVTESR